MLSIKQILTATSTLKLTLLFTYNCLFSYMRYCGVKKYLHENSRQGMLYYPILQTHFVESQLSFWKGKKVHANCLRQIKTKKLRYYSNMPKSKNGI